MQMSCIAHNIYYLNNFIVIIMYHYPKKSALLYLYIKLSEVIYLTLNIKFKLTIQAASEPMLFSRNYYSQNHYFKNVGQNN